MERAAHWNHVYTSKVEHEVSWFEALPTVSLDLLDAAGITKESCVLDVGGGDSHLVDALAARGLDCLAVLDVSGASLERAKSRLGAVAQIPIWIEADVTSSWALKTMDVWHDRAVFHFLVSKEDREQYKRRLLQTLRPGGTVIVATFAPEGPDRCSGLPVQRYSPEQLADELGVAFDLRETRAHVHTTPWGSTQAFQYSRLQRHH